MSNQIFYKSGNKNFHLNENSGILVLNKIIPTVNGRGILCSGEPSIVYTYGTQTINGTKTFGNRPKVNGIAVLLSGEAAALPSTIVYTTGNQTISGTKTFSSPIVFSSLSDEYYTSNGGSIDLRTLTSETSDGGSIISQGKDGHHGGTLNLSAGGNHDGGSISSIGGAGGNGGSINLSGGSDGAGGSIDTSAGTDGGGGSINTSDVGGSINTSDGGGSINTSGLNGGSIDTSGYQSGSPQNAGGSINTSGGVNDIGGAINTSNGGGSINTQGVGSIGLGVAETRTTLNGSATTEQTITLPDTTGTLPIALISAVTALNFGSIGTFGFVDLTIALTGAATTDVVFVTCLNGRGATDGKLIFEAFVSATNTVTVRAHNPTSGAIDPASYDFKVAIIRIA